MKNKWNNRVSLIFVAIAYGHDTKVCRDIYENPCDFIKENQKACKDITENYIRCMRFDHRISIVELFDGKYYNEC